MLPAVMYMLEKTRLDYTARSNPVKVVRAVAAMVRKMITCTAAANNFGPLNLSLLNHGTVCTSLATVNLSYAH